MGLSALALVACGSSGSDGSGGSGGVGGSVGGVGGSGTGGATTGGAGGTAATGGGSGGTSGSAGSVSTVACAADAGTSVTPDPSTRGAVSGSNGTFTDECNSAGNLVEYGCETQQVCSDPPNPGCTSYQTGKTDQQVFDCDGKCVNGRCEARCPAHGDPVVAQGTDGGGKYLFENSTDQRKYACALVFSGSGCVPGQGGTIDGLGLKGSFCTGGEFGNIQVAGCSYTCTFRY